MATQAHLNLLKHGVESWNVWRKANPGVKPDLRGVELIGADLSGADLSEVDFSGANLQRAILSKAVLHRATLITTLLAGASLHQADLEGADLEGACLRKASLYKVNLSGSDFRRTNLSRSDLRGADLRRAQLVETNLEQANLTGCLVYGIAAWNTRLDEKTKQQNLIITPEDEPTVVVDDLEVAQFIYLLLNNEKIRRIIDTVTARAVLILGRFTDERKVVLNAIRENLRDRGYVPILFDFAKPDSRDLTETITTLARMSRFIIADLTEPNSIPMN
jgi:uncharacterized protein YjbI with pentapeptide repeats